MQKNKDLAETIFDWMEEGRDERHAMAKEVQDIILAGKFDPKHHMFTTMAKFMFKNGYALNDVNQVVDLPAAELEEIEREIKTKH